MGDCCSFGAAGRFWRRALWYPQAENQTMASVKEQLKPIILKSLRITDMTPEDLRDDQPLLGGELEIDSIDILQLVLEIERHFGIKLVQANFDKQHLESINVLAAIIESKMAAAGH
jgi:acyl carrier protein